MRRLRLAYPLWRALRRGEMVLFFQPKADPISGRVRSVEALVRWRHPRRGLLAPAEFVPDIERGLWLGRFNRFVLREAIRYAREWSQRGRPLCVSVNVSPGYVVRDEFVDFLRGECERQGVNCSLLCIEIPESPSLRRHDDALLAAVTAVRRLGISVSIDDFGTGDSSLARLLELPIQELKIDRCFTARLPSDLRAHRVVRTAIELGHSLGLTVVAEGVESHDQWLQLSALGCDLMQGFELHEPMAEPELWSWLDACGRDIAELGPRIAAVSRHRRRFGNRVLPAAPSA